MSIHTRSAIFDLDSFFQRSKPANVSASTINRGVPRRSSTPDNHAYTPRVDIVEKDNCYELTMELAGVKKENVAITLENSVLTITAEKTRNEPVDEKTRILRSERNFETLSRSFNLGKDIEQDNIEANLIDGLLSVFVFKLKEPQPTQRKIEIH